MTHPITIKMDEVPVDLIIECDSLADWQIESASINGCDYELTGKLFQNRHKQIVTFEQYFCEEILDALSSRGVRDFDEAREWGTLNRIGTGV